MTAETNRAETTTQRVETEFGVMYVHIEVDAAGRPCGGSISHPYKDPEAKIPGLVEALSEGLDKAVKGAASLS